MNIFYTVSQSVALPRICVFRRFKNSHKTAVISERKKKKKNTVEWKTALANKPQNTLPLEKYSTQPAN